MTLNLVWSGLLGTRDFVLLDTKRADASRRSSRRSTPTSPASRSSPLVGTDLV